MLYSDSVPSDWGARVDTRRGHADRNRNCVAGCDGEEPMTLRQHLRERFERHVRVSGGCYEWTGTKTTRGYAQFRFGPKHQQSLAHRVAWTIYMGDIPNGLCVCHECDNPLCVRVGHLFLGTHTENMTDCARKLRTGKAKLSLQDAQSIIARSRRGESGVSLSKEFSICRSQVSLLKNGKAWRWVDATA